MAEYLDALTRHAFLQNALVAALLASVGCGIMGTYVVVRRIGFIAGGIAHTVLGGVGVAYLAGLPPQFGALAAALLSALLLGWINLRWRQHEDTLVSALWAVGMAVGVLCLAGTRGYAVDLNSMLFGSILLVSAEDLRLMLALDVVIISLVACFSRQFLAVVFDEEFARVRGVPVAFFYLLLLCLVSLTVVLVMRVVGLILVIALLTLPAAAAAQFARTLLGIMLFAIALGAAATSGGLALSYPLDLPAGPLICLLAALGYAIAIAIAQVRDRPHSTGPAGDRMPTSGPDAGSPG